MAYLSLYRKYRSQVFDELVGQEHITRTLSNAIERDRIAHAYLFSGPRGTGKTSTARIFAKCINCEEGPTVTPCNVCSVCESIIADRLFDVVEIDAASNRGIDDVRDLKEKVRVPPTQARKKIYIIDEVHMLTREAFNALLKTLEEPPPHVLFLMATTEPQKLPATILSRCQRFDFRRLTDSEIGGHMHKIAQQEGFEIEPEAVELIVRSADGSLRDGISILDQLVSFSNGKVTLADVTLMFGLVDKSEIFEFMDAIFDGDTGRAFELFQKFFDAGKSFSLFLRLLMEYARDIFLLRQGIAPPHDTLTTAEKTAIKTRAANVTRKTVVAMMDEVARIEDRIRWEVYPRIILEILIIKLIDICAGGYETTAATAMAKPAAAKKTPSAPPPLPTPKPAATQEASDDDEPLPPEPASYEPSPAAKQTTRQEPAIEEKIEEPVPAMHIPEDTPPFERMKMLWPGILGELKKKNMPRYFFFADGDPVSLENNRLVLTYKPDHQFKMEQARTRDNATMLTAIIEKHFGSPVLLDFKISREEADADNGDSFAPPSPEPEPEKTQPVPEPEPLKTPMPEPKPEPEQPQPPPTPEAEPRQPAARSEAQTLSLFDEVSAAFPGSAEIKD